MIPDGATHKSGSGTYYKSKSRKWYIWDGEQWFLTSYKILFNLKPL